jgi:predicted nucleotidyltransferase
MRLTDFEIESIKTLAGHHFGPGVQVFLFGSRTDDQRRGGDIDLFISNPNEKSLKSRIKIYFITDLIMLIGDQKIDVVLDNSNTENTSFLKSIRKSGIQLC